MQSENQVAGRPTHFTVRKDCYCSSLCWHIASTSKMLFWEPTKGLSKDASKFILLDFTKVDYINSSGHRPGFSC